MAITGFPSATTVPGSFNTAASSRLTSAAMDVTVSLGRSDAQCMRVDRPASFSSSVAPSSHLAGSAATPTTAGMSHGPDWSFSTIATCSASCYSVNMVKAACNSSDWYWGRGVAVTMSRALTTPPSFTYSATYTNVAVTPGRLAATTARAASQQPGRTCSPVVAALGLSLNWGVAASMRRALTAPPPGRGVAVTMSRALTTPPSFTYPAIY